jgi:hypothetical protein
MQDILVLAQSEHGRPRFNALQKAESVCRRNGGIDRACRSEPRCFRSGVDFPFIKSISGPEYACSVTR